MIWTYTVPDKPVAIGAQPKDDTVQQNGSESGLQTGLQNLPDNPSHVEETAYIWDAASDKIEWDSDAAQVLRVASLDPIATGEEFNGLIAAEHIGRRLEAMTSRSLEANERGVPYRIQYRFLPGGRRTSLSIWLEDHGRFWPGKDGKPAKARGVVRVIDDSYIEEQRLLYHSDHDELTGQLNRMRLTEALSAVIARSIRNDRSSVLMVISINNLTMINETFGFDIGDEVIAAVGRLIKEKLRAGDTLGRYSSNKFGVVINDCNLSEMRIAADRFMKAVRNASIRTTACPLTATVSIGGVVMPEQASTAHHAMNCALQALDSARDKRFECFMAYVPSPMRETVRQRSMSIADEVIGALDEDRMHLVLQPIVDARTHTPKLYECLLRLKKSDGSIIPAGDFIPVAEQLGMARLIDRRTLELAIDLLRKHPTLHMSLNVSGLTSSDKDWLRSLDELTRRDRSITERLTIEITETAAIQDIDQSAHFVDCLKEMGCQAAIDDFGAGYTSFRNLKRLHVDMVKIDGAFVKNLLNDNADQVFITTMVEIARAFEMTTVAEWVGDGETAELLARAGIDYLQGFLYGMPIDADDYRDITDPLPLLTHQSKA